MCSALEQLTALHIDLKFAPQRLEIGRILVLRVSSLERIPFLDRLARAGRPQGLVEAGADRPNGTRCSSETTRAQQAVHLQRQIVRPIMCVSVRWSAFRS